MVGRREDGNAASSPAIRKTEGANLQITVVSRYCAACRVRFQPTRDSIDSSGSHTRQIKRILFFFVPAIVRPHLPKAQFMHVRMPTSIAISHHSQPRSRLPHFRRESETSKNNRQEEASAGHARVSTFEVRTARRDFAHPVSWQP